jgi:hypothetical protein
MKKIETKVESKCIRRTKSVKLEQEMYMQRAMMIWEIEEA